MIKLTTNTRAVATSLDVDHGLSVVQFHESTALITLNDSMIFDSTAIITDPVDPDATQVIETIPNPKPRRTGLLRTLARRVAAWAVQAVRTARAVVPWVTTAAGIVAARAGNLRRRYRGYAGRHRTAYTWYGRARSTAEFITQLRAATGRQPANGQEGDLPGVSCLPRDSAFVGWVARYIEIMREEQVVLHSPGRHFICS